MPLDFNTDVFGVAPKDLWWLSQAPQFKSHHMWVKFSQYTSLSVYISQYTGGPFPNMMKIYLEKPTVSFLGERHYIQAVQSKSFGFYLTSVWIQRASCLCFQKLWFFFFLIYSVKLFWRQGSCLVYNILNT